eukprot:1034639-Amphidinium_carterae.1
MGRRKISELGSRPLAIVANAYAKLSIRNRFMLEVLGDEVFRKRARGEMEAQSIALTLNAYARLTFPNPVIFDYFALDSLILRP